MTFRAGRGARSARLVLLTVLLSLWPAPAAGHGTDGLEDSDYLVGITATPDLPGVTVRTVETGTRLELVNDSSYSVEILGYSGEPYAEVRPDGVFLNRMSPAPYLNETDGSQATAPAFTSAGATPQWLKASDEPWLRWHDHRAGWMSEAPPPQVRNDPQSRHRILEWTIPLRVGTTQHIVHGYVDWLPPPNTPTWTAGALLLAGGVAAVALTGIGRRWFAPALVAVAGAAALVDAVGRSYTAADYDDSWLMVLVTAEAWPAIAGLSGLGAAWYALTRKPGADLACGLAAAAMALMAGVSRFGGFTSALTPTPWAGDVSRVLILIALGVGAGLAVASFIGMRRSQETVPSTPVRQ